LTNCQAWADWLLVGEALQIGRSEAMHTAHVNKPEGRGYNDEFSRWLRRNGFESIPKSTRSRLFECLSHRSEIENWRNTLPTSERLKLNNPETVLRRWQRATTIKPTDTQAKLSYAAKLKESIIKLSEENERMKREIERGGGDLWSPKDTVEDIRRVMNPMFAPSKLIALGQLLTKLGKARLAETKRGGDQ
jgi:hypothetical protein